MSAVSWCVETAPAPMRNSPQGFCLWAKVAGKGSACRSSIWSCTRRTVLLELAASGWGPVFEVISTRTPQWSNIGAYRSSTANNEEARAWARSAVSKREDLGTRDGNS
jgi:hypothetical protein